MNHDAKRANAISVAISFGDADALARWGSGVAALTCPACGAQGRRIGNPGEEFRLEGFTPLSSGGFGWIEARCSACTREVSLRHRRA